MSRTITVTIDDGLDPVQITGHSDESALQIAQSLSEPLCLDNGLRIAPVIESCIPDVTGPWRCQT